MNMLTSMLQPTIINQTLNSFKEGLTAKSLRIYNFSTNLEMELAKYIPHADSIEEKLQFISKAAINASPLYSNQHYTTNQSTTPNANKSLVSPTTNKQGDQCLHHNHHYHQIISTISPSHYHSHFEKLTHDAVVVSFSGFKNDDHKNNLSIGVEKLGGEVMQSTDFDAKITHVVTLPNACTMKNLAAALTSRL